MTHSCAGSISMRWACCRARTRFSAFLADKNADKRARLIDRVLERPEFVDFWTLQMNDLLMNRKESDHDVRGSKGVRSFTTGFAGKSPSIAPGTK